MTLIFFCSVIPHQVLGIHPSSSEKEIRSAYHNLVKRFHPDQNQHDPNAHEKFRRIQSAYETLSRIKARRAKKNDKQEL